MGEQGPTFTVFRKRGDGRGSLFLSNQSYAKLRHAGLLDSQRGTAVWGVPSRERVRRFGSRGRCLSHAGQLSQARFGTPRQVSPTLPRPFAGIRLRDESRVWVLVPDRETETVVHRPASPRLAAPADAADFFGSR